MTARLNCPECGEELRSSLGHSVETSVVDHLRVVHHIPPNQARKLMEERGLAEPRPVIDDQAIADWNAMVDAGVIE